MRTPRTAGLVAACAAAVVSLSACSGDSDNTASTSSLPTSSTSSSTSSSTTSSSSSTSSTSTPSSSTSSSTSSSSTSSPTSTGASQALTNACVNANFRSNAAVSQWNRAVTSQKTTDLDKAADNFRTTATYLRSLTKAPGDKQFTPLVWTLAKDFDTMADARKNRQTVSTTTYNNDAQKLRTFCTSKIGG
ncbi:hypothetical protein IEE94_07715 [Yimella sp. cx-573]|nr:hypothetical protein [Yimella sp. cx-573]